MTQDAVSGLNRPDKKWVPFSERCHVRPGGDGVCRRKAHAVAIVLSPRYEGGRARINLCGRHALRREWRRFGVLSRVVPGTLRSVS